MNRLFSFLLVVSFLCTLSNSPVLAAVDWPTGPDINAESAILIDADSGAVLYEKNVDNQYYPASITKIMTALLAIENCTLDEVVTFSKEAVLNLEVGSTNMGIRPGEQLCVKDSLYGLMLKSANEVANGLAEHISGSMDAFAELMNKRAAELGCTNTNFVNANGLHNDNHYTSARDMALIAKAAYSNETFLRIDGTASYRIPATNMNEESFVVYMGHKMVNKNRSEYYSGIIGGKTGYTSTSGNTLVTCVERDGMKLICVILKGQRDLYYEDTKNLFDFGFANFKKVNISENDKTYSIANDGLSISGITDITNESPIGLNRQGSITLPMTATFEDTTSSISYDLPEKHDSSTIASITYQYGDRIVGTTSLDFLTQKTNVSSIDVIDIQDKNSEPPVVATDANETAEEVPTTSEITTQASIEQTTPATQEQKPIKEKSSTNIWGIIGIIIAIIVIMAGIFVMLQYQRDKERKQRYQKRADRLSDLPQSSAVQFDSMLKQRLHQNNKKKKRKN